MSEKQNDYTFAFSATVLNHLGRQLYRNFITIIGEAVSNAWDADAKNVWIVRDKNTNTMTIKDDGHGMNRGDIQNKFLKIGYSKRIDRNTLETASGRPFIGAKGIGKLALLSCAQTITVVSKTPSFTPSGCVIDNTKLDQAIAQDQDVQNVRLPQPDKQKLGELNDLNSGTIFTFEGMRPQNSKDEFLRKAIALFFRFSLVDKQFEIYYNSELITPEDCTELARSTQYLWRLGNDYNDPFLDLMKPSQTEALPAPEGVKGFIASVKNPSDLQVFGANTKAGVDLFVNGRLRERDIFRNRPSSRVPENYLYGQIHYDQLDNSLTQDPFTSSREGILEDNEQFTDLLGELEKIRNLIFIRWDKWRLADRQGGDPDNGKVSKSRRAVKNLINEKRKTYTKDKKNKKLFDQLLDEALKGVDDSIEAYADIYLLENCSRQVIKQFNVELSKKKINTAKEQQDKNLESYNKASLKDECRLTSDLADYLGVADLIGALSKIADPKDKTQNIGLHLNKIRYLRNILMHTAKMNNYGYQQLSGCCSALQGIIEMIVSHQENTEASTD